MKKSLMILGLAALVLATSCEREDLNKVNSAPKTFEGDVAYIVVNINDVNDVSTRGSSDGFEYGSASEYAINDAHFYFYASDGEFVAESDVVPTGTANETSGPENVEWKGNTVVTLHGLSGTDYPNWVVTVLNQPAGFTAPKKLDDFATALAENNENGYGTPGEYGIYTKGAVEIVGETSQDPYDGKVYFTMCTSSFAPTTTQQADPDEGGEGYSSTYYFATPVVEKNFALEDISYDEETDTYTDANNEVVPPITIYVERLVAKTRVVSALGNGTALEDGYTYYPITVQEEDGEIIEEMELYVRLEGWELNGVSNNTYMAKRIDTTNWDDSTFGFTWNDAENYRSYWAMSTAYGDMNVQWPDSSLGNNYDDAKSMNDYLRWFDYSEDYIHEIGSTDCQYCGENTNTAKGTNGESYVINSKRHASITNALIFATVGTIDDNQFSPATLVRENGILYTEEGYLNYAASHIYLYTYTESPDATYTKIGPDALALQTTTDGYVEVVFDSEWLSTNEIHTLYEESGTGWASVSTDTTASGESAADSYIDEHFNSVYGYGANGYNDGMMYYSVPIEHLDNNTMDKDEETGVEIPFEGSYGMVRNHIYNLTITGIENIGWGVWDPDEVIIPQEDVETYSLTCQINILSWKLVNQSVTL